MEGLDTVTVTPGRTAWLASATLPLIDPVVLAPPPCANACVEASRHAASTATTKWNPRRFMNASSFSTRTPFERRALSRPVMEFEQANAVLGFRAGERSIEALSVQSDRGLKVEYKEDRAAQIQ